MTEASLLQPSLPHLSTQERLLLIEVYVEGAVRAIQEALTDQSVSPKQRDVLLIKARRKLYQADRETARLLRLASPDVDASAD